MQQQEESLIRLSGDEIIELVRESRNEVVSKLLEDDVLKKFLWERYSMEKCHR